jgi:hypothetical protein
MQRDSNSRRGTLKKLALALAGLAVVVASSQPAEAGRWRGGVRRYGYGRPVVRPRYWGGYGGYRGWGYRPSYYNRGYYGVGGYGVGGFGGFGAPVAPGLPYSSGVFPPVM